MQETIMRHIHLGSANESDTETCPRTSKDMLRKKLYYKRWWKQAGFAEPSGDRLATLREYSRVVSSLSTPSSIILDVGCGNGTFLRMLELEGCAQLIGIDIENVFRLGSREISFIVADPTHLPLRQRSVDTVFARKFVSISDVRGSVHEMCRAVKKNGKLLIDVPNVKRLKSRIYNLLGLEPKYSGARYFPHLHPESFMEILSDNDLEVLQTGGDYIAVPFFGSLILRFRDGILLRVTGRFRPTLCSHIYAVCRKKSKRLGGQK